MRICVITGGRVNAAERLPACDVALFGFGALGEVNYESELEGKTDKFEEVAYLSGACKCGLLCGCITDSRGLKRKSVAVADRGRLLGITDMMNVLDGEPFKSGATLGVYELGGYKVGLCIENDLYFPEGIKALSMYGCNLVAVFMQSVTDGMPSVLARAYAYLYGAPVVLCTENCAYFADITGAIASSTQETAVFESRPRNCYRVVSARRKGLFSEQREDY